MMKSILIAVGVLASFVASAKNTTVYDLVRATTEMAVTDAETRGLNWAVGDTASYSLDISFIKGSMVMTVKSINGSEGVLGQDLDLGFAGKQSCETTLDLNSGTIKKLVCNGQQQQVPDSGDTEVIETKADNVTVPAGTFDCLYIKAKSKKDNSISEIWANPKLIPITGMVKSIQATQMGPATIALKSYKKM